jgi:hypothetical protein
MTCKARIDKLSTDFGKWLRAQPEIDSFLGYRATDLDYVWANVETDDWMLSALSESTG